MAPEREARFYRFEPLDTSGVFLGLGVTQSALLGGGLVVSVAALSLGVPLLLAALPALAGAGGSFARAGGRPVWEWIPLGASWLSMRAGRGPRWYAPLPLAGDPDADSPMPPCLEGVSIAAVPRPGRAPLGAVHDAERATLTALVRVSGPQFVVADPDEQERLLAGWGDVLNQFAREASAVTHLGWSDLARPSGMAEHLAWRASRGARGLDPTAAASYDELVGDACSRATEHEVVVSLTVSQGRLSRRRAEGEDPGARLSRALLSALEALLRALGSAGLDAGNPLAPDEVRRVVRSRISPEASRPRLLEGRLVERLSLVGASSAGPLVVESSWGYVRTDGAFHRTFWVASWPRLAVPPSWLEPFLAAGGITRSITVVFCPVTTRQSRRRIERGLVKLESDAATKEGKGRRVDARHERAVRALLEREQELVAGYAEMAYVGLVTVSASSEDELDRHAEILEQVALESGIELRSLDGRQDLAWAAALPLGLAPRVTVA